MNIHTASKKIRLDFRSFGITHNFAGLARFFLACFWFAFPFQIRTLIYTTPLYESGNFNPFTSFFIHASDGFLLLALFCFGIALWRGEVTTGSLKPLWKWGVLIATLIVFIVGIAVAEDKVLSSLLTLRWIEWGILYYLSISLLTPIRVLQYFMAVMSMQAVIAIVQYLQQSSLGLSWLGEPLLHPDLVGVAKVDWGGEKIIRSYGTFPHPNVLGGALGIALVGLSYMGYILKHLSKQKTFSTDSAGDDNTHDNDTSTVKLPMPIFFVGILILSFALLFTFSRSAWLALSIGIATIIITYTQKKWLKIKLSIVVGIILLIIVVTGVVLGSDIGNLLLSRLNPSSDPNALSERLMYLNASADMLGLYPLGVGLGHSTLILPFIYNVPLNPWELQPVHNFWLLILNELGIIGFIAIVSFFLIKAQNIFKQYREEQIVSISLLSIFLVISVFDHYFFTLYQGQVLLILMLVIFKVEKRKITEHG